MYRVSWALLPSVGEIRVSASSAPGAGGVRLMRILTTTRTRGLAHLGVVLDEARNTANAPVLSTDASPCTVRMIRTDEESIIARQTLQALEGCAAPAR